MIEIINRAKGGDKQEDNNKEENTKDGENKEEGAKEVDGKDGGSKENVKIYWFTMRQEPIVYVNGCPYAPRDPENRYEVLLI